MRSLARQVVTQDAHELPYDWVSGLRAIWAASNWRRRGNSTQNPGPGQKRIQSTAKAQEVPMPLRLPSNHRIAVSLGVDFDAHSVWPGSFGMKTPGYLSRGEFGAEVGA